MFRQPSLVHVSSAERCARSDDRELGLHERGTTCAHLNVIGCAFRRHAHWQHCNGQVWAGGIASALHCAESGAECSSVDVGICVATLHRLRRVSRQFVAAWWCREL